MIDKDRIYRLRPVDNSPFSLLFLKSLFFLFFWATHKTGNSSLLAEIK